MPLDNSNLIIEKELDAHLRAFEKVLGADVLAFVGPIMYGIDDAIKEAITRVKKRRAKLAVVLQTEGGYIAVVERIVNTMRHHYAHVDFFVPNYAFSAGTVLVMSGDAIFMDWYSVLGPIDPQVERPGEKEKLVPALGYLIQFDRLMEKSKAGELTTAEMAFLIEKFDPAELYRYEQDTQLSISLLEEWLAKYKFKDWKQTETRKLDVSDIMKKERAKQIAAKLNDTEIWHSHGRGISMARLRRDLNLRIDDFSADAKLEPKLRAYYGLLMDYMIRRRHSCIVHTNGFYLPLLEG